MSSPKGKYFERESLLVPAEKKKDLDLWEGGGEEKNTGRVVQIFADEKLKIHGLHGSREKHWKISTLRLAKCKWMDFMESGLLWTVTQFQQQFEFNARNLTE